MGYYLEPLHTDGGTHIAQAFHVPPPLIVQVRCERHPEAALEQDVMDGIRDCGLRGMVDGQAVGYAISTEIPIDRKRYIDVRLYRLDPQRTNER